MTTPGSTTLLPMWRSPTASSCSSRSHPLRPWDDDMVDRMSAKSPSRVVQCLNFLVQVERVEIHTQSHKRFHEPVYQLDIYLSDEDDNRPTYQIERTLTELEQLRHDIMYWTTRKVGNCTHCMGFQKRSVAWAQHWPRRYFRRIFRLSKAPRDHVVQLMLNDMLTFARSSPVRDGREPCEALQQVPTLLTNFLVRHELSMDD